MLPQSHPNISGMASKILNSYMNINQQSLLHFCVTCSINVRHNTILVTLMLVVKDTSGGVGQGFQQNTMSLTMTDPND